MIKRKDGSYSQRGLWDNIRANKGSGKKPTKEMLEQERKIKNKNKMGGKRKLYKKGGKSEFGRLSVEAGVDNNPNPTAADRIVGAKKGKKKMGMGGKKMMYQKGGKSSEGLKKGLMALYENRKAAGELTTVQDTTRRDTPPPVDTKSSEYKKKSKKRLVGSKTKKMMGGGMKKMMYKSGGFLEPGIPNIDDL